MADEHKIYSTKKTENSYCHEQKRSEILCAFVFEHEMVLHEDRVRTMEIKSAKGKSTQNLIYEKLLVITHSFGMNVGIPKKTL